jgi:hypothetical protein
LLRKKEEIGRNLISTENQKAKQERKLANVPLKMGSWRMENKCREERRNVCMEWMSDACMHVWACMYVWMDEWMLTMDG